MISKDEQAFLAKLYEENLALLRVLGKIPAPSRQEDLRAAFCKEWMDSLDIGKTYIDDKKNAICEIGCTDTNPVIVFSAHTDIVFPDLEPLPMAEDEERIYAPGIGDDTGNLINLFMGLRFLKRYVQELPCGVVAVCNSCEEGLGNLDGTKRVFETYGSRVRAFVSFDGPMGQCCSRAVGSHRYQVELHAPGGHSYFDFGAPNPIAQAADMICRLSAQELPTEEKTTMNVGTIHGGSTVNSIPEEVVFLYEYRSESENCLQQMALSLKDIEKACQSSGMNVQVKLLGLRPGNAEPSADQPVLTSAMQKIVQQAYGQVDLNAYSTDSNIPLSLGIPACTIGTVIGEGFHTRGEWIQKDGQKAGMQIVAETMDRLLRENILKIK